jgi:hypothetical protein
MDQRLINMHVCKCGGTLSKHMHTYLALIAYFQSPPIPYILSLSPPLPPSLPPSSLPPSYLEEGVHSELAGVKTALMWWDFLRIHNKRTNWLTYRYCAILIKKKSVL